MEGKILGTKDRISIKRVESVRKIEDRNIILKTSYRGPPGPKGDTGSIDDFEIESLSELFFSRLT